MKLISSRIFWGLLLIAGGVLFLLQYILGFELSGIFWGGAMAVVGAAFLSVVIGDRRNWWALIPGLILLVIGAIILLESFVPNFSDAWSGAIMLGGIGLAFWIVYLVNRENWWAIIPGGVMVTLAVVTALPDFGMTTGAVFFIGLGATFGLVGLLPTPHGNMRWAFIPALVLAVMGLLTLGFAADIINYIWPVALILVGIWFVIRTLRRR